LNCFTELVRRYSAAALIFQFDAGLYTNLITSAVGITDAASSASSCARAVAGCGNDGV